MSLKETLMKNDHERRNLPLIDSEVPPENIVFHG